MESLFTHTSVFCMHSSIGVTIAVDGRCTDGRGVILSDSWEKSFPVGSLPVVIAFTGNNELFHMVRTLPFENITTLFNVAWSACYELNEAMRHKLSQLANLDQAERIYEETRLKRIYRSEFYVVGYDHEQDRCGVYIIMGPKDNGFFEFHEYAQTLFTSGTGTTPMYEYLQSEGVRGDHDIESHMDHAQDLAMRTVNAGTREDWCSGGDITVYFMSAATLVRWTYKMVDSNHCSLGYQGGHRNVLI